MAAHCNNPASTQPWIHSRIVDSLVILFPPFLAVCFLLLFRDTLDRTAGIGFWALVISVICIDVAHVYSTLFRTYLNSAEFQERRLLFVLVPLACWIAGALFYSVGPMVFWRVFAYAAAFHFVRQQYGFMMLYSRKEPPEQRRLKWIDKTFIYLATGYPLLYWHTHPRSFHWFKDGDFVLGLPEILERIGIVAYAVVAATYLAKESYVFARSRTINVPKQLIILGTAMAWYVGIVFLNGALEFTIAVNLTHGIPYIALIWIFGRKQSLKHPERKLLGRFSSYRIFSPKMIPVYLGALILMAFIEEGLWNGLVSSHHWDAFNAFPRLPKIREHSTLTWLVPLLALPQFTHYVLDGFIWKMGEKNSSWQGVVFWKQPSLSVKTPAAQ